MSDRKLALAIYLFCTAVYAATAGQRLLHPSSDTHFVYQAQSWLAHRLDLGGAPPHQNDWADVEYLKLRDGTEVAGQFLRSTPGSFRTLKGQVRVIADADISARSHKYYVSFPPFPAVLMLPIGALVVVLFRNVLGVPTFGTFLPALIAASVATTGLLWGMVSIVIVTVSVLFARLGLQRLQLLLFVLQLRLGGGGVQVFGPQCLERCPQLALLLRAPLGVQSLGLFGLQRLMVKR